MSSLKRLLYQNWKLRNVKMQVFLADIVEAPTIPRLAGCGAARLAIALIPMAVVSFAADERLINLDNAAQLGFGLDHGRADFVAHQAVLTEPKPM
jgi:hypothetical protein